MRKNIIEYLEESVSIYKDKIAVIDGSEEINFNQLHTSSKSLALEIIRLVSNKVNKPIAVFLPKSIGSIIADVAVTYSGNVYMNLDVKSPAIRLENIMNLIKPDLVITNSSLSLRIKEIDPALKQILIDECNLKETASTKLIYSRLEKIIDTDPYCIINTSGSTGTPKGVVLNHRGFIDFTEWAIETLKIKDDEIVGSLSPLVFDIYSFEICMSMAKGSTIVILPDSLAAFPIKILDLIHQKKINFLFWVPTIMVNIANMDLLSKVPLPSLKTIWFAGEVFPTKPFNYWHKYLPDAKFVNLYGPIEITLDCTYFIIDREIKDNEPIPIGFPCRNTDILILNEHNELVEGNEEGELCVRGSSLAMGYYNNPEKTDAVFVQNPLNKYYPEIIYRTGDIAYKNDNGEIIFKGRKDSLIKHMGYRIELGEIEHVIINVLKLVENGCVVYNYQKKEITLFYESSENYSVSEMKVSIGTILPKYMIPTVFYKLEELPRNTNGKIDRLNLTQFVNNG